MSDMPLTAWTTLALALAVAAWKPGASPALWSALAAALGLGFLTKGPIGLLLPAFGLLLLWRQQGRPRVACLPLALAAALLAAISVSWFAAVYVRLGWGPLEHFFLRENLQRFAGETYDTGHAPWFYLGAYLAEGLPWSPLLPLALLGALRRARPAATLPGIRLLALWLVLAALPLALSRGKLDYYLLPLYPAASLLIATLFDGVPWGRLERVWARSLLVLLAAGIVLLALYPVCVPRPWLPAPFLRTALAAAAVALAVALLVVAWRPRPWRVLAALALTTAALALGVQTFFLPAFRSAQPNLAIARDVARERSYRPGVRLALCKDPARVQRDILFLVRLAAEEHCDLWDPASARVPFLLLLTRGESEAIETIPGIRTVGEYRYLPATALTSGGMWRRHGIDELVLMANYPTQDPKALARQKRDKKRAIRELWESGAEEEP
jgi:4-amino-4-deoxy-L-arabinose transferase-like glycosyltransferase